MPETSPDNTAQLAERIHDVQNQKFVDGFLKFFFFKQAKKSVKPKPRKQLSDAPESPYTVESAIRSWLKSKSSATDTNTTIFWRWVISN